MIKLEVLGFTSIIRLGYFLKQTLPNPRVLSYVQGGGGSENGISDSAIDIAKYLVEHGADIMHKDIKGRTPLDLVFDSELKAYFLKFKKEE